MWISKGIFQKEKRKKEEEKKMENRSAKYNSRGEISERISVRENQHEG